MTRRNEAASMARESGMFTDDNMCTTVSIDVAELFAALVSAAERERCAKACESWGNECHGEGRDDSEAFDCADLIRALKDGEQ